MIVLNVVDWISFHVVQDYVLIFSIKPSIIIVIVDDRITVQVKLGSFVVIVRTIIHHLFLVVTILFFLCLAI